MGARDDVDQPGEDLCGARRDVKEGEEGEHGRDAEAVDGDSSFCALAEEAGRLAFDGEAVERARAVVSVGVAGGED